MKCGNCGSEIYKGAVYCHVCGKPVAAQDEAAPDTGSGTQAGSAAVLPGTERQAEQPAAPYKRGKIKKHTVIILCAALCVLILGAAAALWFLHGTVTGSGVMGNTSSNILNKGLAARQGDWIYYANIADQYALYKMKTDGTCKTRLCGDIAFYINVSGGWVYYCSAVNNCDIYRVRTDGKDRTRLNSEHADCLTVSGGWLYYIGPNGKITRMKTDGTGKAVLAGNAGNDLFLSGKYLYYTRYTSMGTKAVYKVSSSGGSVKTILPAGRMYLASVEDGWMYYLTYNDGRTTLCRAGTDGSGKKELHQFTNLYNINITGGWIYYFDNTPGDKAIRKMKTDGTQAATVIRISSDYTYMYLNVTGDRIVYDEVRNATFSMYMVRTDGTQNRLIGRHTTVQTGSTQ